MPTKDSTPIERSLDLLNQALKTGIRGKNREAIQTAIQSLESSGKGVRTDLFYKNWKNGRTPEDPQHPGLYMYAGSRKGQVWQFRVGDKFIDQGFYPDTSYEQILVKWEEWRKAKQGVDPVKVLENQKKAGVTVQDICEKHVKEISDESSEDDFLRSWKDVQNVLSFYLYPDKEDDHPSDYPNYGQMLATAFTDEVAQKVVDYVQYDRRARKAAYNLKTAGNQVWKNAIRKEWIVDVTRSPWKDVDVAKKQKKESPYLNESQITSFLQNLPKAKMPRRRLESGEYDEVCQDLLLFQLQTIQRVGEPAGIRWTDVDLEHGVWTLPGDRPKHEGSRAKNYQTHRILLSTQSLAILKRRREITSGDFVFPAPRTNQPFSSTLVSRALAANRELLGIPNNANTHSLRHTGLTQLAAMGCGKELRDRISNHRDDSSDATYQHYLHDDEARYWWQEWPDDLDLFAKGNIKQLEAKRKKRKAALSKLRGISRG